MSANSEFSVVAMMEMMSISENVKAFIVSNREMWPGFGAMDSTKYRKKFMGLASKSKLSSEAFTMVFFFFAVVKKKSRVLSAMDSLEDSVKQLPWFTEARNFITNHIVDYNAQAKSAVKFPGTHIPTINPGLDLLFYVFMTPEKMRSLEDFSRRTSFAQINLDPEMQALAKSGYEYYWTKIVVGTKNKDATEKPGMNLEYYNTSAADKYLLITPDGKELAPANHEVGYTRKEIESYLSQTISVSEPKEKGKKAAA